MALLGTQTITAAGLAASYTAASGGGDKMSLTAANTFLHVKNGGGSPITVTITTQANQIDGLTIPDRTVTVAASADKMIGPITQARHGDINQQASIAYSAVTTVTVAAIRI